MKALICDDYGPPEKLKIVDLPEPIPGEGEALIEVGFAGLNFFDLLVIENKYQAKPPLPFSPSAEFSGRVLALGPGAKGLPRRPGSRLCRLWFGARKTGLSGREAAAADPRRPFPTRRRRA